MIANIFENLNEQQKEAVAYVDGPSLVIAGAGSGKTRVLTYKIAHLINLGLAPYRILALTFTNKAAKEMKERISSLVGPKEASQLWMGTFHSIFARILRINAERIGFKHDFTIYDTNDSKSLIKQIIKDLGLDDKIYKPSSIQSLISNMKNALISPADYEFNKDLRQMDNRANRPNTYLIYKIYWNRCRITGALDFDDLLFYTNILLRDNPDILKKYQEYFQFILVDEYQDTNFAQHLIIKQLFCETNNVCVVGDDAQSIYSFRGANISNILNLRNTFKDLKIFKLEQNYRSTQTIINAANSLIEKNKQQIKKHIFSENSVGNKIPVIQSYSDFEESYVVANQISSLRARQGDSFEDFAVLYRTNAQSRILEEALRKRNIPYRIYGGLSFYQRKEIKDAIAYFRLALNPNDDESIKRIINNPTRGIGNTTLNKVQHCAIENEVSFWTVLQNPQEYQLDVNSGTQKKLNSFVQLIEGFILLNNTGVAADVLAESILKGTKLIEITNNDNTPENISRRENLLELIAGTKEYVTQQQEIGSTNVTMSNFLAEVSLATDQDEPDEDTECVTLMTVHAAKGLEFKNVIIVGVEEDLFPAQMSCDSLAAIEEERRLLYVAITRAKKNCLLTYATSRYKNGQTKTSVPSRFIKDIDSKYLSVSQTTMISSAPSRSKLDWAQERDSFNNWSSSHDTKSASSTDNNELVAKVSTPTPTAQKYAQSFIPTKDCVTHSIDEISIGQVIVHSRFGPGEIVSIDTSTNDAKITVSFNETGNKILLLKFAKFSIVK